jgi:hypothetical protein
MTGCTYTEVIGRDGEVWRQLSAGPGTALPDPDYGYWKRRYYGPAFGSTVSLLYAEEERARLDISNCRALIVTERPDLMPDEMKTAALCTNGGSYVATIGGVPVHDGPDAWAGGVFR